MFLCAGIFLPIFLLKRTPLKLLKISPFLRHLTLEAFSILLGWLFFGPGRLGRDEFITGQGALMSELVQLSGLLRAIMAQRRAPPLTGVYWLPSYHPGAIVVAAGALGVTVSGWRWPIWDGRPWRLFDERPEDVRPPYDEAAMAAIAAMLAALQADRPATAMVPIPCLPEDVRQARAAGQLYIIPEGLVQVAPGIISPHRFLVGGGSSRRHCQPAKGGLQK